MTFRNKGALLVASATLICIAPGNAQRSYTDSGGLPPEPVPPPDVLITHDVVVGQGGPAVLHAEIMVPRDPSRSNQRGIVYVHGGGWGGNNKIEINRVFFLAQSGYLVASVEYRLSTAARWPAQIEDCKLGVRWLRANAAQYHIDPDHIGVYGTSAGAHLASALGTMHDARFEGHGGYEGVSSQVQAVVDAAGPVDFRAGNFSDGDPYISDKQRAANIGLLNALFGEPFARNPGLWIEGSPISHVHAGDPPFLIAHGEHDQNVSPAQAKTFADTLRQAGVPVEWILIKNGNHGLGQIAGEPPPDPNPAAYHARVVAFFDRYLRSP
jgi:acetyl esterase/lipase